MRTRLVASAQLDECGQCGGLFVPRTVLVQLIKDRDAATAEAFVATFGDVPPLEVGQRPVTYVHCPACNVIMNRTQFSKGAKVIVDICGGNCGVWFDMGEFARVINFVMDGGLDRAAERIATERARDEAAQGSSGPKVVRQVVLHGSRFASAVHTVRTPLAPRNTAAIWSVFETLIKPRRTKP
jgi:Zn-finger nucleic acid-binding protein